MNDPNKAINVNLSSLLSLKAELLRKQAEVSKAKATRVLAEDFIPNKSSTSKKLKKQTEKDENKTGDDVFISEYEDPALLEKSQKTLEAKSRYYERMTRCGGKINPDENCLVQFHRKQEESHELPTLSDVGRRVSEDSTSGSEIEDDESWVEYTDCLGRTRKCLQKDLERMKKQDKELAASMPERLDQSKANWMLDLTHNSGGVEKSIGPDPAESVMSEGVSMISKHDEMRANWEKKHEENLDKPSVHYQDVFFDEARQHGVGYYAFSTDEAERAKQQRELEETRKQTIAEQEQRDKLRAQREKIIADRVRAAKNRQRARLGLPPLGEDDEDSKKEESFKEEETKEDRRERKRLEKLKRKQEELAAAQELERKHHIRPWDREKNGVAGEMQQDVADASEWHYKPERLPMSQAEWNEQKRAERIPEFAPPAAPLRSLPLRTNFNSSASFSLIPPVSEFENFQSCNENKRFQRRSYQTDSECYQNSVQQEQESTWPRGAAIPPPVDQDSYQPPYEKKAKSSTDLERSIEAGLRFLRNNCDKNALSQKSSWSSKADY